MAYRLVTDTVTRGMGGPEGLVVTRDAEYMTPEAVHADAAELLARRPPSALAYHVYIDDGTDLNEVDPQAAPAEEV